MKHPEGHPKRAVLRTLIMVAALALLLTACPTEDPETDPEAEPDVEDAEADVDMDAEPADESEPEAFTYVTGIFEDMRTDNFWAYYDPDTSVWTGYVLEPTRCMLFNPTGLGFPAIQMVPELADAPWEPARQEGDEWVVEVTIRDGVLWSDGEPLTAADMAFTWDVVQEFELGGNWQATFRSFDPDEPDIPAVTDVAALDDTTVRITFNQEPGLPLWPHGPGLAPWMAEHHWAPIVEEARESEAPAGALFSASGAGDPSCGPSVLTEWEPDAFVRAVPNPNYVATGDRHVHYDDGGVVVTRPDGTEMVVGDAAGEELASFEVGPFFEEHIYALYTSQDAAVLALRQGEVDFLYNPSGLERGLQDAILDDPELEASVNEMYGIRYLGFNVREEPMSDRAFRQALATVIDREFMAETVLGGSAIPLYTMMPRGNVAWFDEDVAAELAAPYRDFADEAERLERAVEILSDAGYTWDEEPRVDEEEGIVISGAGIRMPDGSVMRELDILSLSAAYDPLRATYGLWIERWARDLGIPARTRLVGLGPMGDTMFARDDEGNPATPEFDLFILGWELGTPAMPDFYETFWHSRNAPGFNLPGFSHPEYDAGVDEFLAAGSQEEAYEIIWTTLEPVLQEELPYVVLFAPPVLEFYRASAIQYPFSDSLGGLQFGNGFPALVRPAGN